MPTLADEVDRLIITARRAARKIDTMYLRGEAERRSELDCLVEDFKDFPNDKRMAIHEALSRGTD